MVDAEAARQYAGGTQHSPALQIFALPVDGEIIEGADLARLVIASAVRQQVSILAEDVIVVAQKAVSKAEGRLVRLDEVTPSPFAVAYAQRFGKDARQTEVVLRESRRIVKMDRGILIAETHHGFVCANAGVDASNVAGGSVVSLLPVDPDRSAAGLRGRLEQLAGIAPAVIVSDTFGRTWRNGLTNVAIGAAGMAPLRSYAGQRDRYGYELRVTTIADADELAAAAELVMGKTSGTPFAVIRGFRHNAAPGTARELVRDPAEDLFR